MPTIVGSKSGTRPHLELDWSVNSQDITNNRSSVKLKLYLKVDYAIGYSARYTGTLQGASFTSSSGYISKPGRYLLTQRDVWIGHNSDGTKTATLTADYNLNITWGGTYFGKIPLSGSANLGTIPRASTLSAFSFAANLKPSTAVTINYTVSRKSTAFRHQVQLRDGSHVIQTWDNQDSDGASTVSLSATNVNSLLSRMSKVASRSLTLRVATRSGSGGGWIGSAVTRNATATVDATVKPTVSALTVSQTGNSVSTHYLQGKSKVTGKFTPTAVGGATIVSSSITVRRKTSNTDVQTINSNSGTTGKTVSLTGTYQAQGTAKDSRGRVTNTAWVEFTVTAYSTPTITDFSAARNGTTATTVNISRATTHTVLGTSNHLTYSIQRRTGTGAWTNVNTGATGSITTSGATGSATSTGNSVTASYEFRMVITDKFGESAESIITVPTQRVVLDIHKNEGVGIGKIHERGDLDINGNMYLDGFFSISNANAPGSEIRMVSSTASGNAGMELTSNKAGGVVYIDFNTARNSSDDGIGDSRIRSTGGDSAEHLKGALELQSGIITFTSDELRWKGDHIMNSGYNSNGYWVRYHDGTMIQRSNTIKFTSATMPNGNPNAAGLYQSSRVDWTFPTNFHLNPTVMFGHSLGNFPMWFSPGYTYVGSSQGWIYSTQSRTGDGSYWFTAVGRWKQ